jgi:hypothetical protein
MKRVVISIAAIVTLGIAIGAAVHFAPADETPLMKVTTDAMNETYSRIVGYLRWKKRLPKSLDELRDVDGPDIHTTDGWGRPLMYTITSDGFLLKSLGRDGEPGGTGPNEDHAMHYQTMQPPVDPKPEP